MRDRIQEHYVKVEAGSCAPRQHSTQDPLTPDDAPTKCLPYGLPGLEGAITNARPPWVVVTDGGTQNDRGSSSPFFHMLDRTAGGFLALSIFSADCRVRCLRGQAIGYPSHLPSKAAMAKLVG